MTVSICHSAPGPPSNTWFNLPPSKCNFSAWSSQLPSPPSGPSSLFNSSICSLISSSYVTPLFLSAVYCLSPRPSPPPPSPFSSLRSDPDISLRGFFCQPAFMLFLHGQSASRVNGKNGFCCNISTSLTGTWRYTSEGSDNESIKEDKSGKKLLQSPWWARSERSAPMPSLLRMRRTWFDDPSHHHSWTTCPDTWIPPAKALPWPRGSNPAVYGQEPWSMHSMLQVQKDIY